MTLCHPTTQAFFLWSTVLDTDLCHPDLPSRREGCSPLGVWSADTSGCQPFQGLPLQGATSPRPWPLWGCTQPVTERWGSSLLSWPWLCGSYMEVWLLPLLAWLCFPPPPFKVVLVSKLCGLKRWKFILSQLWRLKVQNQGVSRALLPPGSGLHPSFPLPSCMVVAVEPERSFACRCITPVSASVVCLHMAFSSSYTDTSPIGLGPTQWPHLNFITSAKTLFPNEIMFHRYWRLGLQYMFFWP